MSHYTVSHSPKEQNNLDLTLVPEKYNILQYQARIHLGGVIFEEINWTHAMLCQISKFDFEMFLFYLASENLTVTIKWKIKKNCLLSLHQEGMNAYFEFFYR